MRTRPLIQGLVFSGIGILSVDAATSGPEDLATAPPPEQSVVQAEADGAAQNDSAWPRWLKLGLEYQARGEVYGNLDFENDHANAYFLNRFRVSAGIAARPWLRFYLEGQDSRAPGFSDVAAVDSVSHHFDLRQGFADFGAAEPAGWGLRIGRQELAFGDERLICADNRWDNLGQTFDAVRLSFTRPVLRLDWFASFKIVPTRELFARPDTGNQLYGFYASLTDDRVHASLEPYFFWNRNRRSPEEEGLLRGRDVYTIGIRLTGELPAGSDYNVEVALQRGRRPAETIRAWAGHWEIGHKLSAAKGTPRVALEYNFASGGNDPFAGRHGTFDDLYPAGYNKYGTVDPFPWRNLQSVAGGLEFRLGRHSGAAAGYRSFWLANRRDALYSAGDDYYRLNPNASSSHIGNQVLAMVTVDTSSRSQLTIGYAYFFSGRYLLESALAGRLSTPYAMWNFRY